LKNATVKTGGHSARVTQMTVDSKAYGLSEEEFDKS
jgi:hypothetical protein